MMDTMYELPSMENVRKCIITEDVVLGKIPPELIYADPEPLPAPESADQPSA